MPKNLSQDFVSTIKKHYITCSDTNIILKNQILYFEESTSQDSPTKTFAKQIKAFGRSAQAVRHLCKQQLGTG